MEDCTESHQSEIKETTRANDKLWKFFPLMPDEHRALPHYGDSFQSKMRSLDDENGALLAEKQKIHLERLTKTSGRSSRHVGNICRNGSKLTKN